MDAETRASVLALLDDVAQSEHRLRHLSAFEALVKELGFEIEHAPHGSSIREPKKATAKAKKG